jgi:NAD(P)-dependent dehydrogenase (short-subunit alcohol dehydrogenase family)
MPTLVSLTPVRRYAVAADQPDDIYRGIDPRASSGVRSGRESLTGHVAIVTGGGRGIGRAMAQALAMAGAAVTVVARSEDQLTDTVRLIEGAGGRALALAADVTDPRAVARMVEATEQQLGPVDVLVNNAGVGGPIGPLWEVDPEEWWRGVEVHLRGTFLCARAVLAGMIPRRQGRIINVVGGGAGRPYPYMSSYGCAKAAMVRLTDTPAAETQEYHIAVFAIRPGWVRTALTEEVLQSEAGQRWMPQAHTPFEQGRDRPPERAAQLVTFLASGHGDGLSGRCLFVGDDVAELVQRAEEIQREDLYVLRFREERLREQPCNNLKSPLALPPLGSAFFAPLIRETSAAAA